MHGKADRLRAAVLHIGAFLRPLFRLYSWWRPFRIGKREFVVLPDAMALIMLGCAALYIIPYPSWKLVLGCGAALLLSPFVFLTVLVVHGDKVRVLRLFAFLPYWVHNIPVEARFDLYEAWEDPGPSDVAFGTFAADALHLGTASSADPLYRHVSGMLERAGWQATATGWAHFDPPRASPDAHRPERLA